MTNNRELNKKDPQSTNFVFEYLEEEGRLQFFFHSPNSKLPIRDVLNQQKRGYKTEPHIEIGAENYINRCYQSNNIIPFLRSKEKYLFLFTTCKIKDHKYYNRKCIVGFISKKNYINIIKKKSNKNHYAVLGDIYVFSFNNSLPINDLGYKEGIRIKKVDKKETGIILNHFGGKTNILDDCIKEIKRLDIENKTCKKDSQNFECKLKNQCLRWRTF